MIVIHGGRVPSLRSYPAVFGLGFLVASLGAGKWAMLAIMAGYIITGDLITRRLFRRRR